MEKQVLFTMTKEQEAVYPLAVVSVGGFAWALNTFKTSGGAEGLVLLAPGASLESFLLMAGPDCVIHTKEKFLTTLRESVNPA